MVILFFDGECGLCNRAILQFLKWEAKGCQVHFAPLQGAAARDRLSPAQIEKPYPSLLVWDGEQAHDKSSGLAILSHELRAPLRRVARFVLTIVPERWGNAAYDAVARTRHRASPLSCALHLDDAVKKRFLA